MAGQKARGPIQGQIKKMRYENALKGVGDHHPRPALPDRSALLEVKDISDESTMGTATVICLYDIQYIKYTRVVYYQSTVVAIWLV